MESQSVVYWITVCSLWWPHSKAWSSSTNLWMTTALCLSLTTGSVDLLIDSPGKSAMSCQILPAFLVTSPQTTKIHPSPLHTTEYTESQYYLWSLPSACHHPWWKRCLTPLLTLKTYWINTTGYCHAVIARIREQIMSQEISDFSFTYTLYLCAVWKHLSVWLIYIIQSLRLTLILIIINHCFSS